MNNKPTGFITFLFTDIEGSTKLSQDFPDTLQFALEKHHSILQNAIESNNGFVFEIIGDAFCCAFQKAEDAVNAAIKVQLNLTKEEWDDPVIKIRIGIHSGNAEWNSKTYMGYITLARTARVMSAAYGEQILISNDAYRLLNNLKDPKTQSNKSVDLNSSSLQDLEVISFRDLGERRLKDVIQPIRLFQIIYPGLREDFPPLKTLDARPNNLPVQLTSFIGREEEMKQIKDLLMENRLLTIIGSGGAGKTRLAMQTGADMIDDFSNGVFITELAPVSDPSLIVQTLMDSIGIKEEPGLSPKEKLTGYLKSMEILIILDNCEHLINECANLVEFLLSKCPGLKIIATSRESLNCSGEYTYRVPSLSLPDTSVYNSLEILTQYEAVRLFIERALSVNSGFRINNENAPALAEICSRLDGIPLAIELAAARANILTVDKINERLDDRFKLLSGGKRTALPRQQTLKALIDWSYDLLTQKEKILWHRVSVFSGGWTLEASEEIFTDENISKQEIFDLLGQLADKSIIIFNTEKNRYMMLETIKQYGKEKLIAANEENFYRSKHLKYYMELSKEAESKLNGSEIQIWLEKLESEHGNLQSAITWTTGDNNKEDRACLAGALGHFWEIRGHNSIGIRLLESILDNGQNVSKPATAKVLLSIGILARNLGEFERAQESLNHSLRIYREIENKYGIVSTLNNLGIVTSDQGNYEQSQKLLEESLILGREIGDKSSIADSLSNLGTAAYHQGNYEQAQKLYEESLILRRGIGYKQGIAMCLNNLGSLASRRGNIEQAQKLYEESLTLGREIGDKTGIGMCLNNLGGLAFDQGNSEQAQNLYEESLAIWHDLGDKLGIVMSLNNLGMLESSQVNYEKAQKLYEESLILSREIGDKIGIIESLIGFSGILSAGNHLSRSAVLLGAVENALKSFGLKLQAKKFKFHEQIANELHKKLSDEEFAKYFEEGKKMTLEEACQLIIDN